MIFSKIFFKTNLSLLQVGIVHIGSTTSHLTGLWYRARTRTRTRVGSICFSGDFHSYPQGCRDGHKAALPDWREKKKRKHGRKLQGNDIHFILVLHITYCFHSVQYLYFKHPLLCILPHTQMIVCYRIFCQNLQKLKKHQSCGCQHCKMFPNIVINFILVTVASFPSNCFSVESLALPQIFKRESPRWRIVSETSWKHALPKEEILN